MDPRTITYPPDMLPSPDEGEEAEVIIVDPETGEETTVWHSD